MSSFFAAFSLNQIPKRFIFDANLNPKFPKDKIHYENAAYAFLLDGYVLNKNKLMGHHQHWHEACFYWYEKEGQDFFKSFRGSFRGILFDKKLQRLIIFNDHLGTKPVFTTMTHTHLYISSHLKSLTEILKNKGKNIHLNHDAAMIFLTFGQLYKEHTLLSGIKKIMPGSYLIYEKEQLTTSRFYQLSHPQNNMKDELEILTEINRLFNIAVNEGLAKDNEYHYQHLITLSGGLDSRMTTFIAHELHQKNITNLTFSQCGAKDHLIAAKIAADLKHSFIFHALDDGHCLYAIDELTHTLQGLSDNFGSAHAAHCYSILDFSSYGLIHSGQLGDAILGGSLIHQSLSKLAQHPFLLAQLPLTKDEMLMQETDILSFRGLQGANAGLQTVFSHTETYSPFMSLDFLEFCLKLPQYLRANHHLYFKWINTFYPNAAQYPWEKTGTKITQKKIHLQKREVFIRQLPSLILRKFKLKKHPLSNKKHMNPIYYWYKNNVTLQKIWHDYYDATISLLKDQEIRDIVKNLYHTRAADSKILALTLLSFNKLYLS